MANKTYNGSPITKNDGWVKLSTTHTDAAAAALVIAASDVTSVQVIEGGACEFYVGSTDPVATTRGVSVNPFNEGIMDSAASSTFASSAGEEVWARTLKQSSHLVVTQL